MEDSATYESSVNGASPDVNPDLAQSSLPGEGILGEEPGATIVNNFRRASNQLTRSRCANVRGRGWRGEYQTR